MEQVLIDLASNKLFNGCIMLMTNIGGRYITLDIPQNIEKMFSNYFILRILVIFSIFFMATRDIKTSILLSLLFLIFIKFVINEKSYFCIFPKNEDLEKKMKEVSNEYSKEEYEQAKKVIQQYENRSRNNR